MIGAYLACLNGAPELLVRRVPPTGSSPRKSRVLVSPLLYTLGSRDPTARDTDWPSAENPLEGRVSRQRVFMSANLRSNLTAVGAREWDGLVPLISTISGLPLGDGEGVVCRLPDCVLLVEKRGNRYGERVLTDGSDTSSSRSAHCNVVGHHDFRTEFTCTHGRAAGGATDVPTSEVVRLVLDRRSRPATIRPNAHTNWWVLASLGALLLATAIALAANVVAASAREPGNSLARAADVTVEGPLPSATGGATDLAVGTPVIPLLFSIAAVLPADVALEQLVVVDDRVELRLIAANPGLLPEAIQVLTSGTGLRDLSVVATAGSAATTSFLLSAAVSLPPANRPAAPILNPALPEPWVNALDTTSAEYAAPFELAREVAQVVEEASRIQYDASYSVSGGPDLILRLAGPTTDVVAVLPHLDRVMSHPSRRVRSLSLRKSGEQQVALQISLLGGSAAAEDAPASSWSYHQVAAARAQWPSASPDRLASVLGFQPKARPDSAPNRYPVSSPGTPPFRYLGVIRSEVSERFAVRFVGEDAVVLLSDGESAFGWSLTEITDTKLRISREGEEHEIGR